MLNACRIKQSKILPASAPHELYNYNSYNDKSIVLMLYVQRNIQISVQVVIGAYRLVVFKTWMCRFACTSRDYTTSKDYTTPNRLAYLITATPLPNDYTTSKIYCFPKTTLSSSLPHKTATLTLTRLHYYYLKRPRYLKPATLPHTTAALPPKRLHFLKTDYTTPNRLQTD